MAKSEKAAAFFEGLDRPAIVEAIKRAESKSFGEIRVHLHHGPVSDALEAAKTAFQRLGMEKTVYGSGCLLFLAPESRAFAVVGGAGIHEKVGEGFWAEARDAAQALFADGRFTEGIVAAVEKLGDALALFFPKRGPTDTNELPDEVSEE
ncbi:MAG TPA: TPM domain-containing protein [Thermoanaerobaculia bacterium]|nr:TPM domain-containing protein [Thermoanaerobaculia bacterium]